MAKMPVYWRDRMTMLVEAKRAAAAERRDLDEQMRLSSL